MEVSVNADRKRREVVALAAELFDREGYHSTSVERVAAAAGIRKPTLYHYFSSKDEILFWIHEEFIDLLIGKAEARPPGLPATDALREMMGDVLELMETHRGHVRVFFEHYRELAASDQETIRSKRDRYQDLVQAVVERGISERAFRPLDARLVTLAVFGMCNWAYQWYRSDGPLGSRELAQRFSELLFEGLRERG